MAYEYYRNSMPGWGTSQFQFGTPPAPTFQPQPSWGGLDFYNAHAINPDAGFYNSIMSRAPYFDSMGLGRDQARYWHRRIYSGMAPLMQVLPTDIGAAAAYEAYRMWKNNSFLYEPLSADRAQQQQGLVGMAIAEATRLWQYAGRPADTYGLRAACEAAAAAATALADRWVSTLAGGVGGMGALGGGAYAPGYGGAYGAGPYRGRRGSFSGAGGSPYLGAGGGAGMLGGGISPMGSPMMGAGGMGMGMGGGSPMLGAGAGAGIARSVSPIPGAGLGAGMGPGAGGPSMGMGMGMPGAAGAGMYGAGMGAPGAMGMGGMNGMNGMNGMGAMGPMGGMGGMGGMGMGGMNGMGGMAGPETNLNVQSVPPGSTIVLERGSRRAHRSSGGRRRARSVDVIQTGGPGAGMGMGMGGMGGGMGMNGMGGYGGGGYGGGYGAGMGGYGGAGTGAYGIGGGGGYGGGMYGGGGRIYGGI